MKKNGCMHKSDRNKFRSIMSISTRLFSIIL